MLIQLPRVTRRTKFRALRLLGLFIGLCLLSAAAIPVLAHANLVRSEPEANAVLDGSPSQVKLWFSEVPEPAFSQIQILDRLGNVVAGVGSLQTDPSDPKVLSVSLPTLAHGIYTVTWQTLSAVDGHVTAGGFAFVIGQDQVPAGGLKAPTAIATSTSPTLPAVLTRWLSYLAVALLTGGFAFVPLVFQPALNQAATQRRKSNKASAPSPGGASGSFSHASGLFAVLAVSWLALLLAGIAGAAVEANAAGGTLVALLGNTRFGSLFWVRMLLLAMIGLLLVFRQSRWWRREMAMRWWWFGVLINMLILVTISLGSHAAALPQPVIAVAADWLHMLTASLWIGGLVALLLALLWLRRTPNDDKDRTMAMLIMRFSQVATLCLIAIGLTGLVQTFFQVNNLWNLIDTPYGLTLLLKLGLLIPLLGVGVVNLLMTQRRIAKTLEPSDKATQPWKRLILRTVSIEIALVAAILLVTGILTNQPPSREAFGPGTVLHGQANDVRITVAANPGLPGLNTFDIYLKDTLNRPIDNTEKVALIFDMVEHDMGQQEAVADRVEPGHYVVQGGYISMIGTWQTEVLVRRTGQDDARTMLTMPVVSIQPLPSSPTLVTLSRAVLGLQIIIVGGLLIAWVRRLLRSRRWANFAALILGCVTIMAGLGVGATGFATGMDAIPLLQNPIPVDAASLARGQQIYKDNCLACHGESGAGDGEVGKSLDPPPANFQIHMAAGHTDGQIFDWVTRGITGSAMPGFGMTLTDQQRWDVINYIRTFANPQAKTP
ncbi:MAG: copper resistance protein CopC [Chloroflexota bacterium]